MFTRRHFATTVAVLAMLFTAVAARAQGVRELPADALVVIKINNLQALSGKIAAMAKQMKLDELVPPLADPLGALKQQLNIREGLNARGDLIIGIYEPAGTGEPDRVILVPVTDFKAFMGNMKDVKEEGGISSFTWPGESEPTFAVARGGFAAVSTRKELLTKGAGGVEPTGFAAKHLASADAAAYVDIKRIAAKALPELKKHRPEIMKQLEAGMPGVDPKFRPVMKVLVSQALNVAEGALETTQSAVMAVNIGKNGINTVLAAEFAPEGYMGRMLASFKQTDAPLLTGLPSSRKLLLYGGMVIDSTNMLRLLEDFMGPIAKELEAAGPDGKAILDLIDSIKQALKVTDSMAFAYVAPTGQIGQQSALQAVSLMRGDAAKLAGIYKNQMQGVANLMRLLPQAPGTSVDVQVKPGAKTVDGVSLDQMVMQFKFDANTPEGAAAAQRINLMYGPGGWTGYMGAADARTYLLVMGGGDELLGQVVAAAKKNDEGVAAANNVKAVDAQLPAKRIGVWYLAVDNIASMIMQYMAAFGMPAQVKIAPDLSPIAFSLAAEGSVLRMDMVLPADLMENIIAVVVQFAAAPKAAPRPAQP